MKITKIETFCTNYVGFVKVTDEENDTGWGQVSTYNADISVQVLHRQVAPWTLGENCDDLDNLLDTVYEREHKFPGSYLCRAMGGFDTAVWDLRGKKQQMPVVSLLGGEPQKIRAYASSMRRDIIPREEAQRFRALQNDYGFDAFKFRVGAECGRDVDEWPGRSEEIVPTVGSALENGTTLMVDANSCYSPPRAIELGKLLEDCGVSHFEEPCPYWELDQTKQVTDALSLDVTGGEQDHYLPVWRRMIDMRAVDIVQPDVCYVGGISRLLRVAKLAQDAGLTVTPHCANLSMVTLFTMHVLGGIANPGKYVEFSIEGPEYYPWQVGLFRNSPYDIEEGHLHIPSEPGWGVEINPDWLEMADYLVSEI